MDSTLRSLYHLSNSTKKSSEDLPVFVLSFVEFPEFVKESSSKKLSPIILVKVI